MSYRTFILDQGETLGGAERFIIDFLKTLSGPETERIGILLVGAKGQEYLKVLPKHLKVCPFPFPSLKGGVFTKFLRIFSLFRSGYYLKQLIKQFGSNRRRNQVFANTPRTMFVAFLAKKFFHLDARVIIMIHDFTIPAWLLKHIAHSVDVIVVNSVITRQTIRKQINEADHKKIRIIENGIDFKNIPDENIPQKFERVVILGRIDPRKGQIHAVEAADLLYERNPELQFFVVGNHFEGDPATTTYAEEIKALASKRELSNVHFLEEVEDPFEVFHAADIILALPIQPETFGRIVIEGLALGKLVIAFEETGPKQILESFAKYCGQSTENILVEKGNAMTLAETIGYFADNPDAAAKFTSKGREFVQKHYSLEETRKRLVNLLTE